MSEITEIQVLRQDQDKISKAVTLVTDSVTSPETKRKYESALDGFLRWLMDERREINKASVQAYKEYLRSQGKGAASINLQLSAIKALAREAADNGLADQWLAQGIQNVSGVRKEGKSTGNWLTLEQAQALIMMPDTSTVQGLRDRAVLAVFLGCGLRRSELAALERDQIQKRDGRWVIKDLVGKRNKVRTVPMPAWVYLALSQYTVAAGIDGGLVFRYIHKTQAGNKTIKAGERGISAQAVYYIVTKYAEMLAEREDIEVIKPHDLRRTFAKLARKAGGELTQIQKTLGHSSVQVTEAYVGEDQDLRQAPGDLIDLHLL